MAKRKSKKKSSFWTCYFLYVAILIVLLGCLFMYVRGVMVEYEANVPESYILSSLDRGGDISEFLEKNCFRNGFGNDKDRSDKYYQLLSTGELKVKNSVYSYDATKPVYNVLANDKPLVTVALKEGKSKTKLGIINIPEWEVDTAVLRNEYSENESIKLNENGRLDYTVSIPEGFTLVVDGAEIDKIDVIEKKEIKDFEYISAFVDVPGIVTTELKDLCFEPVITAHDNSGAKITADVSGRKYSFEPKYAESIKAQELVQSIADPMAIGELWSKFMTDDVGGSRHGLETVRKECKLMPGTQLYTLATNWATSVDVTFVSGHRIDSFTNETVGNFVMYNDKFVSCDVYFEKNMTLKTGAQRVDVFSNRMCFVYADGSAELPAGWYLADMISIQ